MTLHDLLARDLDTAQDTVGQLDVDRLSRVVHAQGARVVRRRRAVTAIGSVAAAAVLGVTIGVVTDGPAAQEFADTPTAAPNVGFDPADPGPTGTTTARGVAAGLEWALRDVQDGSATQYRGQQGFEWYSYLQWRTTGSDGFSVVGINVQTDMGLGRCDEPAIRCRVRTLADGGRLMTVSETTDLSDETAIARTATLLRPDGVRVAVSATNANEPYEYPDQPELAAETLALSMDDLTAIARQPYWGGDLPTYFLDRGEDLASYEDIDSGF